MPARACADRDDAIHAHFRAFLGMAVFDYILKDEAAIGLQLLYQIGIGSERQHDDGHFVFEHHVQISLQPRVALAARRD